MMSDLQALVATLRESVNLLREDVKGNNQRSESKLDTHSTEIRELMTEIRSTNKTIKVVGIGLPICISVIALLWSMGSKLIGLAAAAK